MENSMEEFKQLYNKYIRRPGAKKLLDWLCTTDFFRAPASTKYHSSHEGGLVEHSLHVFERLAHNSVYEYGKDCGGSEPFPEQWMESIAVVALLHDLCKVHFYALDYKNQKRYCEDGSKRDPIGTFEWETILIYKVDERFPFGHGEKSVFLINQFMRLSPEEALAIRWHMGDFSEQGTGRAYEMCPLALQLHIADLQASYLDEVVRT